MRIPEFCISPSLLYKLRMGTRLDAIIFKTVYHIGVLDCVELVPILYVSDDNDTTD